ncbi:MAG: tetratricopeptide repeat protein, partial [Pseudonocardiaceae bacterium]
EVDERAAAYRSLLDGRRTLVVLDNAATVEQIRPLLPGTPSCLVVVTSRDALAGLVARDGARRLDLDLLPFLDAVALLRALIGERVEAEPDGAVTLAGQCARLPLALRVAAELAASRPATSLVELVGELADEQRRLDLLDAGGDPRTAVRPVFSWSYRHLSAEAARAFRLLGQHPGSDLDSYAAAALVDTSRDQAQHLLDLLGRAHLIAPTGPGRYGIHDLLRAYATYLATTEDSEAELRATLTRLFDHYLATAAIAMDALVPAEKHRRPRIPAAVTPTPPLADPTAARAWLDVERATLVAVTAHTATRSWPDQTIRLATILFRYLEAGGHYPDAVTVHTHALHAARDIGDLAAEAHALTNLGTVYWQQGSYQKAIDRFHQALTLAREIGDRLGEGRALGNLGNVHRQQGRYQQATDHQQQAVALFREIGEQAGELIALANLGVVFWRQGRYQQAEERLEQALTLSCEIGNRTIEAHALGNLGVVFWRQGRYQQGEERLEQAVTLFREIGDRAGEAEALDHLGNVHRQQGRYQQATDHQQHALALSREIGDRAGEAEALNDIAATCRAVGELHEADTQHNSALTLAVQIGDRYEQARAHDGLAHTHHATGDPDQARHHWQQALTRYTDLGVPEADDVRAHLAALAHVLDGDSPG